MLTATLKNQPPRRAEFGWPGGDHPGALVFACEIEAALEAALLSALRSHLPVEGAAIQALAAPDGAIGRYAVSSWAGAWFVRVSRRHGDPALEQAITGWLQQHGVAANHLKVAGVPFVWQGETLRLDVRPLVTGRHFDDSTEDLRRLAQELANCHAALREFPGQAAVRAHAEGRAEVHAGVKRSLRVILDHQYWSAICEDAEWAKAHADWFTNLLASYTPQFHARPGAQCLHAQIHRANVLFTEAGEPVLVDFEEAVQTFAPVAWDLAYFVQRFCLHDAPAPDVLRARLAVVREGYGAPLTGLVEMMRQTAWYSAVILVDYHGRGIRSPRAEYEKFLRLEQQAVALAPLLEVEAR